MIINFKDFSEKTSVAEVGGKAYNLMKMMKDGINVPEGFTLSVDFFDAWFKELKESQQWKDFYLAAKSGKVIKEQCDALKDAAESFALTEEQKNELNTALEAISRNERLAVRSSSPEEDTSSSSFAGIYETYLGIDRDNLENSIRECFKSCLDYRIVVYKEQSSIDVTDPKIAVVVQSQIDSDVAGVAFSLNPLNNSYDEALITSNFGLGETVVSGTATPDNFVIDKTTNKLKEKTLGTKEFSLKLVADGTSEEKDEEKQKEFSLSDKQVLKVYENLCEIEKDYQIPIDIEWALSDGEIYILQARPITTYYYLPDELRTLNIEKKRLFWDVTLSVQGFDEPLSFLGADIVGHILGAVSEEVFGQNLLNDSKNKFAGFNDGRIYANIDNVAKFIGHDNIMSFTSNVDPLINRSLSEIDLDKFGAKHISKSSLFVGAAFRSWPRLRTIASSLSEPEVQREKLIKEQREFFEYLEKLDTSNQNTNVLLNDLTDKTVKLIARNLLPSFLSSKIAMAKIRELFKKDSKEKDDLIASLDQTLPGNVTVEMSHSLYRVSEQLDASKFSSAEDFFEAFEKGELSDDFYNLFSQYLRMYGHRSYHELDAAEKRGREKKKDLSAQIYSYAKLDDESKSPVALYKAGEEKREKAYQQLLAHLEGKKKKKFEELYRVVECLGGLRESPKYNIILAIDKLRSHFLSLAENFDECPEKFNPSDIFSLSLKQVLDYEHSQDFEGLEATVNKAKEKKRLLSQCKQVFPLIDSRGRFYRPKPPKAGPGEFVGQAISPGKVEGRIRVLSNPTEKPLEPGDILVAKATDPGWTPLFVNAAAIILEVGGPLQHGALVAREYGKPCVSGILSATDKLHDGEIVSVDGDSGVVTVLKKAA